jgi:hypothetical protein
MTGVAVLMLLMQVAFGAAVFVGYIVFLVAAWRLMRAHGSLAESAHGAVGELRHRQGD